MSQRGTPIQVFKRTMGRGIWIGLGLAIVTAGAEKYWMAGQHHDHGHGHAAGHH